MNTYYICCALNQFRAIKIKCVQSLATVGTCLRQQVEVTEMSGQKTCWTQKMISKLKLNNKKSPWRDMPATDSEITNKLWGQRNRKSDNVQPGQGRTVSGCLWLLLSGLLWGRHLNYIEAARGDTPKSEIWSVTTYLSRAIKDRPCYMVMTFKMNWRPFQNILMTFIWEGACMCHDTYGGHPTTCRNQCYPPPVLGARAWTQTHRLSRKSLYWPNHLAGPSSMIFLIPHKTYFKGSHA